MSLEYEEEANGKVNKELIKAACKPFQQDGDKNRVQLVINQYKAKQLREYYKEYITEGQKRLFIPCTFHEFILQFAEIGFMQWREKNKK